MFGAQRGFYALPKVTRAPVVKTQILFSVLGFLYVVYPFIYNSLLYFINLIADVFGHGLPPRSNLLLMGWKDALVIPTLVLLLINRRPLFGLLAIAGILAAFATGEINGIKVLFEPVAVLLTLYLYRDEGLAWFHTWEKKGIKTLSFIVLFILAAGIVDLSIRANSNFTQDDWTRISYMRPNNQYRCAKLLLGNDVTAVSEACLNSPLNFYKIDYKDGNYVRHQALFLPVGDSVVFSILIFYFLILFIYQAHLNKSDFGAKEAAWITSLAFAVFLTLNRVNSLFVVTSVTATGALGVLSSKRRSTRMYYTLSILLVLAFYTVKSHYLLSSLADSAVPSNRGHLGAYTEMLSRVRVHGENVTGIGAAGWQGGPDINQYPQQLFTLLGWVVLFIPLMLMVRAKVTGWAVSYSVLVLAYFLLSLKLGTPIRFLVKGTGYSGSTESDFLKGLVCFGAVGVAAYSIILSFILDRFRQLIVSGWKQLSTPRALIPVGACLAMGAEFFIYQFFAPYFISGYVVYGSFIGIWFLLTQSLL